MILTSNQYTANFKTIYLSTSTSVFCIQDQFTAQQLSQPTTLSCDWMERVEDVLEFQDVASKLADCEHHYRKLHETGVNGEVDGSING